MGDDGIEEEVNFSVQNSSSRCQIGIDVKHHSLKIVSSTKKDFEILIYCSDDFEIQFRENS